MKSLTKTYLDKPLIDALARDAFGSHAQVVLAEPIEHGWYNAGYRLDLRGSGPPQAFLKIAPDPGIPVLRYERDLMRAEAEALERLAASGVGQVPALLATDFGRCTISADCMFLEWCEGVMLSDALQAMSAEDRLRVRSEIAAVAKAAHGITAPCFGYPLRPELQADTWREAFALMVAALLADAEDFGASLAIGVQDIGAAFAAAAPLLDSIDKACLTHFDLWDKNVIVRHRTKGWILSAVLDWERGFHGDPLADLFSLTLTATLEERQALIAAMDGEHDSHSERDATRRAALYRAYLWLIMIVEAPSRGFGGSLRTPASSAGKRLLADLAIAIDGQISAGRSGDSLPTIEGDQ